MINTKLLKNKRISKGYTQEDIARLLNITLRHYQNIEKGKSIPNVIIGLKICSLLNINPYDLFIINTNNNYLYSSYK